MKKILYLLLVVIPFIITNKVYAECNDQELLNFANRLKIEYKDYDKYNYRNENGELVWTGAKPYSYLLAFSDYRKDIVVSVTNNLTDEEFTTELIPGYNVYAVGCPNNLDEITYTVNVYGGEKSECPNELIKTTKIKIPPFNEYSHTDLCDKNPTHELCKIHADTRDITYEEFKKQVEISTENPTKENWIKYIIGVICIFVPLIIIIIILEKKNNKKPKEDNSETSENDDKNNNKNRKEKK